jgi:hypothetical protein
MWTLSQCTFVHSVYHAENFNYGSPIKNMYHIRWSKYLKFDAKKILYPVRQVPEVGREENSLRVVDEIHLIYQELHFRYGYLISGIQSLQNKIFYWRRELILDSIGF